MTLDPEVLAQAFGKNPEAAAMAVGMELLAASSTDNFNIVKNLYEGALEREKQLQLQLAEAEYYAGLYWQLRHALTASKWLDLGDV